MKVLSSILVLVCLLNPTIHAEETASPTAGPRIVENIRYSETAGNKKPAPSRNTSGPAAKG